jgi:hypothetical protein
MTAIKLPLLNFYLPEKVYAQNVIGEFALQYNFIGDNLSNLNGKNALFLDSDTRFKNNDLSGVIPKKLEPYFSEITELKPILIKHRGKTVRKFYVYWAKNYQNKINLGVFN